MTEEKFNFENLEVYNLAVEIANDVYSLTRVWPKEYLFDITGQLRRAVLSISLNVAEGSGKSLNDFKRFLDIARGSCFECIPILDIAYKNSLLDEQKKSELRARLVRIAKMLSKLKTALSKYALDKLTNNELTN